MLSYLPNRPDEVLEALRHGEIVSLEEASEQLPDLFLIYAIESGLLDQLSTAFPDPRTQQPEIPLRILLAAGIVGHFAGLYALSVLPYALHSARLLRELGVQVCVNQPGRGISRRGTQEQAPFHGDVLRKLLEQIARQDKAQKRLPGQTLIDWFNQSVGALFCRAIDATPCVHILDCTDITVPLDNDRYQHSGVTSRQDKLGAAKTYERGYKLGTLRSLLDEGAVTTAIAWDSIERHDTLVTHDLVRQTPHLHPGDLLLEDRGFLDAATITHLKKDRGVDVYTGLKSDMVLMRGAAAQAQGRPGAWRPHPTRKGQQIQLVTGLGGLWEGLEVPMNVCVVRFKDTQTGQDRHIGFATTDLSASAQQIIKTYQTRPEIEEDYRQLKSASWSLEQFATTRLVQILWHVILTLLAYNLFEVYANTQEGRRFAGKTKQRIEREQRLNPASYLLVCTTTAFGLFPTSDLLYIMLDLPEDVRQRIRTMLVQPKE